MGGTLKPVWPGHDHRNPLIQQMVRRLGGTLLLLSLVAMLMVVWLRELAMEKASLEMIAVLSSHFQQRLRHMAQEDEEGVVRIRERMEELLQEATGPVSAQDLRNVLAQPGEGGGFGGVAVLDGHGRLLLRYTPCRLNLADKKLSDGVGPWLYDWETGFVFRVHETPLSLANGETGRLLLFRPLNQDLLEANAFPGTILHVFWQGSAVASSLDGEKVEDLPAVDGVTHGKHGWEARVSIPWEDRTPNPPLLVIHHHEHDLLTGWEILAGGVMFMILVLLASWLAVGQWMLVLVRRIGLLGQASRELFQTRQLSEAFQESLDRAGASVHDEVQDVAIIMTEMARRVQRREQSLQEGEERFNSMADSLHDALFLCDGKGVIHYWNHGGEVMFGLEREVVDGMPLAELFDAQWLGEDWQEKLGFCQQEHLVPGAYWRVEGVATRNVGDPFHVDVRFSTWERKGKINFTGVIHDVSEQRLLETRDFRAYVNRIAVSALLEVGLESLPLTRKLEICLEIILTVPWLAVQYKGSIFLADDAGDLVMAVQKGLAHHLLTACQVVKPGYCLCGRAALTRQIVFTNALDDRHDVTFPGIRDHGHYCVPILLQERLLGVLNLYVDHGHVHQLEEEAFLITVCNTLAGIIEHAQVAERVKHMASHDALTGLPNRRLFQEHLGQELRRAVRNHQMFAVAFLDLDHFKEVNDTLGHDAGDLLLKAVATRLGLGLRRSDILARLGGDEFTIILSDVGSLEHAQSVGDKLLEAMKEPFMILNHPCQVGASIGMSLFPAHGQTVEVLLQKADQAMYQVKRSGRNGLILAEP